MLVYEIQTIHPNLELILITPKRLKYLEENINLLSELLPKENTMYIVVEAWEVDRNKRVVNTKKTDMMNTLASINLQRKDLIAQLQE